MNEKNSNKKRKFTNGPVKWLLGRQLIAGIKWIAVYAFYGEKIHPRDWMHNEVEDFSDDKYTKADDNGEQCFWFDYMADSGDDNCAVYNIAYLCMSDLWLDQKNAAPDDPVRLTESGYYLPRGEFLFVGGDTAYHIADYSTLVTRFQKPFNWAYQDLSEKHPVMAKKAIFAIPGNHDYYDALDGFNRQFCMPADGSPGQLNLDGFERSQQASYVAIQLPFKWMFWGMDTQGGKIDFRQKSFFLSSYKENKKVQKPKKLIVATPEPTTKFGKWVDETAPVIKTFADLSLATNFRQADQGKLDKQFCRLDISGDIHHYARYWGEGSGEGPKQVNYASIISGGGGAFLHASHTDIGEITPNKVYPSRIDSHNAMIEQLFNPYTILQGGYVWLAGAVIVLFLYFAATVPDSTWSIFSSNHVVTFVPNEVRPCTGEQCCSGSLLQRIQCALSIESMDTQQYNPHILDFCFSLGLLALLIYAIFKIHKNESNIVQAEAKKWNEYKRCFLGVFGAVILAKVLVIIFVSREQPYPVAASMLSLLYLLNAVVILGFSRLLADIMIARAKYLNTPQKDDSPQVEKQILTWSEENFPIWMLILGAIASAGIGLWYYGTNVAAIAFTDTITLSLIVVTFFGLVLLAVFVGGNLKSKSLWFWSFLGIWHAVLQLTVAFFLTLNSEWVEIMAVVAVTLGFTYVMPKIFLLKDNDNFTLEAQELIAKRLLVTWVGFGLVVLLVAVHFGWDKLPMEVTGWRFIMALALGAVLSCVWFGWYLAVSLSFNGHNNEAGGGARLPRYRQFIRFKVTEKQLTGYVIGIDIPQDDIGQQSMQTDKANIHLVDVFSIRAR